MTPRELIRNYHQRTINSCQYSKAESLDHFLTKCKVLQKYVNTDWKVMSECEFKIGRADLVCWCKLGDNYLFHIIEILHSEKESNIENKKKYYPTANNINLRIVKTSDNLDEFDI